MRRNLGTQLRHGVRVRGDALVGMGELLKYPGSQNFNEPSKKFAVTKLP